MYMGDMAETVFCCLVGIATKGARNSLAQPRSHHILAEKPAGIENVA
ncbi:MAG: hypothetical protein PVH24_06010 [Candidatus Zixiibacteriota bacterium]|jgi:hypothetical protein